jgi:chromosome segregation ATPase
MAYDPAKAHAYYERVKQLKGRQPGKGEGVPKGHPVGSSRPPPPRPSLGKDTGAAQARVTRLRAAVSKLQSALSEAQSALHEKRANSKRSERKTEKKNSDGKSTAKEKQSSKEYRDKHKQELSSKRKHDTASGGGSSSSSKRSSMSVDELETRIRNIKSALADAKRQLSNANQQLGQLAHSDIVSEPQFNESFARFRSAERIPST